MYTDYIRWQFILAPRWLAQLAFNEMQALLHLFSVPLMFRTLLAHWHKDAVAYRPGTLGNYAMTFAWNMISRGIGFCIRVVILAVWLSVEMVYGTVASVILIFFILSPLLIIITAATGAVMLVVGI
ncbi:MAG: hypothetical protein COT71_01460 [Candidatus Andersenbacteria bacterium CG10_big_fil_rev_8_21_14_0_10_54_11]|uniref:Uncharacterized protein n=1 Tax=Candidatus Andersenbacteria bacterium CG10_big_fil_rev_8_21_14_0_10_54_11 TaxID=1974485 RepID=A0A2M6WZY7_9BACT|nr:MAG: hypothetical protein COT71_01460 [Candidatus Andersenbacteria bacterium CG10_big_fil_rev_8_21_14_0_10_54_11]